MNTTSQIMFIDVFFAIIKPLSFLSSCVYEKKTIRCQTFLVFIAAEFMSRNVRL